MGTYNYFGATASQLYALFPGAVAADFGGAAAVQTVMGRIAREVSGALEGVVYHALAEYAELEMVQQYATAGITSVTIGITPAVAGTLHLWRLPRFGQMTPGGIVSIGGVASVPQGGSPFNSKPVWGFNEMNVTGFNVATGVITFTDTIFTGDRIFATYQVDCENAAFSWPSVADAVLLGTAAELGNRMYTSGDQSNWALIQDYRARYAGTVGAVGQDGILRLSRSRQWVPDELRRLRWFSEIEPEVAGVGSIELRRG